MRIAFLTPEFVTESNFDGGLANYLNRVTINLKDMGHEPVVIVASDRDGMILHNGIEVHKVMMKSSLRKTINVLTLRKLSQAIHWVHQSRRLNIRLKELHRKQPFDIAQYASYTATALFRWKNIPAVVRISSYQKLWDKHYNLKSSFNGRVCVFLELRSLRRADGVFGPSDLIATVLSEETHRHIEVIESPFLINEEVTDETVYRSFLQGKSYLLFFGTLGRLKGVDIIAEILHPLLSEHQDLHFVFAGKQTHYQGLPISEHILQKAGPYHRRVLFLDKLTHKELYPIVSNAYLVVLPSRIDNLPNTCIESMALGKVVIGSKGASFEQLIEDGKSGFLCDKENPKSLLDTIETVMNLVKEEIDRIGANARERIEKLAPIYTVTRLVQYYQSVIAQKSKR